MLLLLFLLMILLPIAEIYVIIQVGDAIGLVPTLALLIVDGFVGAALARSQGRAVIARFQQAMSEGRVPTKEAFDGALIAVGGAMLLAPGFITDVIGLSLLLPPSRAVVRTLIAKSVKGRRTSVRFGFGGPGGAPGSGGGQGPGSGNGSPPPGWQPPPGWGAGSGADPFGRTQRRPDYDYEGTAQEVTEPPPELGGGEDRPESSDPREGGSRRDG